MKIRINGRVAVKRDSAKFDINGFSMVEVQRPIALIDNATGEVVGTYSNRDSAMRGVRKRRAKIS